MIHFRYNVHLRSHHQPVQYCNNNNFFFLIFQQTENDWKSSQCNTVSSSSKKNHKKENSLLKFLALVCIPAMALHSSLTVNKKPV